MARLLREEQHGRNILRLYRLDDAEQWYAIDTDRRGRVYRFRTRHELSYVWTSSPGGVQGSICQAVTIREARNALRRGLFASYDLNSF